MKEERDSERGSKIVRKATEILRTARRDFEPLQFGVLEMNLRGAGKILSGEIYDYKLTEIFTKTFETVR